MASISNQQKALLHVAKAQLGLEDDVYREILYQEAGVRSAKDLSLIGLEKVMRRFRQLGFRRKPQQRKQAQPQPDALITKGMLGKIQHLYEDLGWDAKTRQIGFNKRVLGGRPWPQTREEGNKIIEALKSILARHKAGDNNG